MIRRILPAAFCTFAAMPVMADAPGVATDILPIHGLVARVMDGVGTPDLIVPPGVSPHGHALRPSEARALQNADLVVWMGPELTPWMEDAVETLATDAHVMSLLGVDGTELHMFRTDVRLDDQDDHDDHSGHDEGHDDAHEDEHGHDDHDDKKAHDDHDDHAEHGDENHDAHDDHDDHDHHDHDGVDPHAWLDPANAKLWLGVIATQLSKTDPDNAATYAANAAEAQAEIDTVTAQINADLADVRGKPYIVFHDAYQYFETRFDMPATGSISLGDAAKPSPARLSEIRNIIAETGATCVFSEVQFNPGLVNTVIEGTQAQTAMLDPLGTEITSGPGHYAGLLSAMAAAMKSCL